MIVYLVMFASLYASGSWEGKWHINWRYGSFILNLEQHGSDVNGTYEPANGVLSGSVQGDILHAKTVTKNANENSFVLTLSDSGRSFFGNAKDGNWVTGSRIDQKSIFDSIEMDQSSPLKAFYTFLVLGNSVREGNYEVLEEAMHIIHFDTTQDGLRHPAKLALVKKFFYIIDECMVDRLDFFKKEYKESDSIVLHQLGSDINVPISFIQNATTKLWYIKLPESKVLDIQLKALLKARNKYEIDPKDNLKLTHARAAIRTFYEQYDRWEKGGRKYVISTLNLSEIDPAIHEWQAPLLSYYLKSVLDRINYAVYQEVPNDPKSKKPYIHFHHRLGSVVIAPYEKEGKVKWQFTPRTLETIDVLYSEMEHMKGKHDTRKIQDNNLYFGLKSFAKGISPWLLHKVYYTELWQIFMLIFIVMLALAISFAIKNSIILLFKKFYLTKRWTEEMIILRYIRPIQIVIFGIILLYGAHQLGLSNLLFSVIKSFTHLLMVIGVTWIAYNFISIFFAALQIRARKTSTNVDEILFSLAGSILRIGLITIALFIVAEIFNIPYKTVVAGLGIGGLAFAIAAKDTISNFFGSAIIIADRPFKTGDRIKIGEDIGVITNVGIRSTKIRTIYDTLLTVPNNKITHEMIDNYSERHAMRVDTEFYLSLKTTKAMLDKLDSDIESYLKINEEVETSKIILTGVNDYTKRGILFGVSFFVKAVTEQQYSAIRHRVVTELGEIVRDNYIEMIMIHVDNSTE